MGGWEGEGGGKVNTISVLEITTQKNKKKVDWGRLRSSLAVAGGGLDDGPLVLVSNAKDGCAASDIEVNIRS